MSQRAVSLVIAGITSNLTHLYLYVCSSVDPYLMHYCLVVNTRRYYSTLCEAQGERNGVSPPDTSNAAGFNFPREQAEAHKNELASKAARLNASHLGRGSGGAGGQLHEDIVVR